MDPASLAVVGLVGSAVSAGTGFLGSMQQGSANAEAAKYQQQIARNNQQIAEQNARYAIQAGRVQAQHKDFKTRSLVGTITAGQGASGVDVASPTSTDVRESQEQAGRLDTETIMARAGLQARGYESEAASQAAEAELAGMRARNAQTAGVISGFGSLLGGATSFADKWLKYQTVGIGSSSFGDWSPRF